MKQIKPVKRITCLVMAAVMVCALAMFAGCATAVEAEKIVTHEDLAGKTIGTTNNIVTEAQMAEQIKAVVGVEVKEVLYYDTMAGAVAALKSDKVDAVLAPHYTAAFFAETDPALTNTEHYLTGIEYAYVMVLRADSPELLESINTAIESLTEDGTIEAMTQELVEDITDGAQLEGKTLPHFEGAPTYVIGLSGDNVPVDYVAADGEPAGFNIELLSKISELLQVNFEVVVMANESKYTALASNKIDVFFIQNLDTGNGILTQIFSERENIALSSPYLTFDCLTYIIKK